MRPALHAQTNNMYRFPLTSSKPACVPASQGNAPPVLLSIPQTCVVQYPGANAPCGLFTSSNRVVSSSIQPTNDQFTQKIFKPLKSIALGKDKHAIQQISVPLKMDNLSSTQTSNCAYGNLIAPNSEGTIPRILKASVNAAGQGTAKTLPKMPQQLHFVPYVPKKDSLLVKRNIITNEAETMNRKQFFSSSLPPKTACSVIENSNQDDKKVLLVTTTCSASVKENRASIVTLKAGVDRSKSQNPTLTDAPKSSLAALQELFPPPISMIPVCLSQPVQNAGKSAVSRVVVLQSTQATRNESQLGKHKTHSKANCKAVPKPKRMERKTVKQLLQERYQHTATPNQPQTGTTRILKPLYKLPVNGVVVPQCLPVPLADTYKRPNIMKLPSAAKLVQSNVLQDVREASVRAFQATAACGTSMIGASQDFLLNKMTTSKDFRPRYYDMCELNIGSFKVDDDVDSCGRFRSKLKVLFKKSMFTYDFPVSKCNQVDLSNYYPWEQMARIQVPFRTVVAINMRDRNIVIQVRACPQVSLKRMQERHDAVAALEERPATEEGGADDNSLWMDAVQNSFIHRITLRKRQADNLKTHLCQFDSKFLSLFRTGCFAGTASLNASPFEEELGSADLRRLFQKNKKNVVRRLPQWDYENSTLDLAGEAVDGDLQPVVNPIVVCCSCRTSCRSLRCSCAKAAKSCGSGDNVCLCTNCDNPLNVLESLGMDLDFSLKDCCLFQNIYGIQNLPDFLVRDVKLSCCNTVGRVVDCIPGNHLCPNTACDASLEFSWCRGVICYPERNPRNHCSICGQCCFSNGRHCPICNRCYVVTPKCPDCPNCRGNGFQMLPLVKPSDTPPKPCSKPEIILLDSSSSSCCVKSGEQPKPEDGVILKQEDPGVQGVPSSPTIEEQYFIDEENKSAVLELLARLKDELKSDLYT